MSSLPFVLSISSYVHTLYERIEKCVNYQRAVKLLYTQEPAATCTLGIPQSASFMACVEECISERESRKFEEGL